jgi:diaminopimelate decarboxylase
MDSRLAALFADAALARDGRGELHLGEVALREIASAVGTPAYVYHADMIRSRYREFDAALAGVPHTLCYAVKANSNLAVLRLLAGLGAGADIVSGGELERSLAAGFAPDRIVFSGVGKSRRELAQAIEAGVGQINAESVEELHVLASLAHDGDRQISVGLRVNPDVTTETHPYIATGKHGIKFGIPADQVLEAARLVAGAPGLTLTGIAVHLGSQLLSTAPYAEAMHRLLELLPAVQGASGGTVTSLGLGGGLGIRYDGTEAVVSPEAFAAAVVPVLAGTGLHLHLEPGRCLVGSAGVLVTEVLYRKHSGGRDFVIVDAGMNDLVRPSHYHAHHEIVPVGAPRAETLVVDVVGPICETGDFLALERQLPEVAPGEYLAVLGAGAYGFVMSSQYNTRGRAAEVMVDGSGWWTCRPRETVADLLRSESAAPPAGAHA